MLAYSMVNNPTLVQHRVRATDASRDKGKGEEEEEAGVCVQEFAQELVQEEGSEVFV